MSFSIRCTAFVLLSACGAAPPQPVASTCSPIPPASVDSATRAELVAARDTVWRAYYHGDTAALGRILPEPMVGMGQSRAAIIASALEFSRGLTLHTLDFACDEFYASGDVAVVFSDYSAKYERNGESAEDAGRAIEVFERRDGRWVNPSWHLDPRQ